MTKKSAAKQTSSAPILPRKSHGRPPESLPKLTRERIGVFLNELRENGGIVWDAAGTIGVSRFTLYKHREEDPVFAAEWDAAVKIGTDALEDEVVRRAKDTTLEERSDKMLKYCLDRRAPIAQKHEITGANGGPLQTTVQIYLPENGRTNGKKKPRGDK